MNEIQKGKRASKFQICGALHGFWLGIRLTISIICLLGGNEITSWFICIPIGPYTGAMTALALGTRAHQYGLKTATMSLGERSRLGRKLGIAIIVSLIVLWFLPGIVTNWRTAKPSERELLRYLQTNETTLDRIYTLSNTKPQFSFFQQDGITGSTDKLSLEQLSRFAQIKILLPRLGQVHSISCASGSFNIELWFADIGLWTWRSRGVSKLTSPPELIIPSIENYGNANAEYEVKYRHAHGDWYIYQGVNND